MHSSRLQSSLSDLANFVMVAWRNDTFIKPQVGCFFSFFTAFVILHNFFCRYHLISDIMKPDRVKRLKFWKIQLSSRRTG